MHLFKTKRRLLEINQIWLLILFNTVTCWLFPSVPLGGQKRDDRPELGQRVFQKFLAVILPFVFSVRGKGQWASLKEEMAISVAVNCKH